MSVEEATAQLNNTTINDTTEQPKPSNDEAIAASAAEGRRLYVGNLAYATTEKELKDFFKEFLVESTSIPTNPRTSRPVGYAFVDLSTPSEAERAIAELNGQSILERKVSVQLAKKPEAHENGEGNGETRRRNSTRGRGRGRGRGGRANRGGRGSGEHEGAENQTSEPTESAPTNLPGQVLPLTETTNESLTGKEGESGTMTIDQNKTGKPRQQRERKQRGPPEDGIPSKTKVMVANLPYDLTEDKLLELFKDYTPSSAKIALRPIPRFMIKKLQARNEPRKGRGFGFVTLGSEDLQKKACDEMNGKDVQGREIAVKVAIDSPGKEDEDPNAPIEGEAYEDSSAHTAEGSANAPAAATSA